MNKNDGGRMTPNSRNCKVLESCSKRHDREKAEEMKNTEGIYGRSALLLRQFELLPKPKDRSRVTARHLALHQTAEASHGLGSPSHDN